MTMTHARVMKEVRPLIWPVSAVSAIASLALSMRSFKFHWGPLFPESLTAIGFFVGLPLLASWSMGFEFQYRTFGTILSQPVERVRLWRFKFLATLATVTLPALLFGFGTARQAMQEDWLLWVYVLLVITAALPVTLVARSIIGGCALNVLVTGPLFLAAGWFVDYLRAHERLTAAWLLTMAAALMLYAVAMIRLGRRMFLRFESVDNIPSVESVLPGANFVPGAFADMFRARPRGVILNLIRRELRLLRIVWPFTLISVLAWIGLVAFRMVPDDLHPSRILFGALAELMSILIALLAGSMSLGEERSWGTHEWQLTLPGSPSLQWFVKLCFAISHAVVCGALLPMSVLMVAGRLMPLNSYLDFLPRSFIWLWPLTIAGLAFAAFWSACVVKGAARASMLVLPIVVLIFFGGPLGEFLANASQPVTGRLIARFIAEYGPIPLSRTFDILSFPLWNESFLFAIAATVLVGIALLQSHRFYRTPSDGGAKGIILAMLPLFAVMLVGGFVLSMLFSTMIGTEYRSRAIALQLHQAIENSIPANGIDRPYRIDSRQLLADTSLSNDASSWASHASALVVPQPAPHLLPMHGARVTFGAIVPLTQSNARPYGAVMRFSENTSCAVSFQPSRNIRYGLFVAFCD